MKVFICSLTTLVILGILVFFNASTVRAHADDLINETKNLPEEPDTDSSDRLIALWYEYEDFLNITVSHTVTDQIEISLYDIKNAHDAHTYNAKKDILLVLLTDMKRSASLSFDRII